MPTLFSFPTFSAWTCQGKLTDKTQKEEVEDAREKNWMPNKESEDKGRELIGSGYWKGSWQKKIS